MMKGKRLVRLPFFMKLGGRQGGGIVIFLSCSYLSILLFLVLTRARVTTWLSVLVNSAITLEKGD